MDSPCPDGPPDRIANEQFVLRCWDGSLGEKMKEAIDLSLPELQAWMEWAPEGPADLEEVHARLSQGREAFEDGIEFLYAVMDPEERDVVGSIGLHRRGDPGSLEIGYWIRTDWTGRGIGTGAARALTRIAIETLGAHTVAIRCDPLNTRSAAIPSRLGYRLAEVLEENAVNPMGEPRDTMIWEMTAERFADGRPVA